MKTKKRPQGARKTEGSILVVAMIVLIVLTLIGMATITTSNMETMVAVNDVVAKEVFYCSESSMNLITEILAAMNKSQLDLLSLTPNLTDAAISKYINFPAADPSGDNFPLRVAQQGVASSEPERDMILVVPECDGIADILFVRGQQFEAELSGSEFMQGGTGEAPSSKFAPYDMSAAFVRQNSPGMPQYRVRAGAFIKIGL